VRSREHAVEPAEEPPLSGESGRRAPRGRYLVVLSVAALGVVYGDIGTSPLYAVRACFHGTHAVAPSQGNVLGVMSLVFWSLALVISLKYVALVMRAHNHGEGGILALLSLLPRCEGLARQRSMLCAVGLFGAALLYGDGMITPAISVLSAVEGLHVDTPVLDPYVVPATAVILAGLFVFQRRGTGGVGAVFGPLMLIWFVSIATLGAVNIARAPDVLVAVDPRHAVRFFAASGWNGFLVLGAVFLVVTGGEALYADMGHFGSRPIRLAWFTLVLPALVLNYLGQGALLLRDTAAAENPFFRMIPGPLHYPMVALATVATIIASQAIISGAFSLTRQAVLLGYSPRLKIIHTSRREVGQIYVPAINWTLMAGTIGLVVAFRSSSNLTGAYGVAVSATMAITTVLLAVVARERWGWPPAVAALVAGVFLAVELAFLAANMVKVVAGGWVSLAVACGVFTLMTTWRRGRLLLAERLRVLAVADEMLVESLAEVPPVRVPGTAVFLDRTVAGVPSAFLHNLRHNRVMHEHVVFLTVLAAPAPYVAGSARWSARSLGLGIHRMIVRLGFMEYPDIPAVLARIRDRRFQLGSNDTTFFLGDHTIVPTERPGMAMWRKRLFTLMARNARSAAVFFHLPPNRVVELGAQIEL